jgi:hypothetical protein
MYKNFNLTDEERQQIMEQHKSHGYKKPLSEQSQLQSMKDPNFFDKFNNTNDNVDEPSQEEEPVRKFKPMYDRVEFNNGGKVSIQASSTHYSEPRNDEGPYNRVEIGYPTRNTRIPKSMLRFIEQGLNHREDGELDPYDNVYPYVPASIVRKLIQMNGGVKSGEVPPLAGKTEVGEVEMDEDFDGMASKIEPYSKFESTERLMNSITDRLITAAQLQEWSLVEEVVSDLISFKKNQPSDEPMDDGYESSVENDDYDERQERNYGVED